MNNEQKQKILNLVGTIITAILAIIAIVLGITSCTSTRTITNVATYTSKGDTTQIIQTKTTEVINLQKQNDVWK